MNPRTLALAGLAVLATAFGACGSDDADDGSSSGGQAGVGGAEGGHQTGGAGDEGSGGQPTTGGAAGRAEGGAGGSSGGTNAGGAGATGGGIAGAAGAGAHAGAGGRGGATGGPCTTRVSYGDAWVKPPSHAAQFDDAAGEVTWDGTCTDEGADSYATLSNGWKPYFKGHSACVIAIDTKGCGDPSACTTRVTYGAGWEHPTGHTAQYDETHERAFAAGPCVDVGGGMSSEALSNGWDPYFSGACALSFEYEGCGGLYANPVVPVDCPDPGVLHDGTQYVMVCTGGGANGAFPMRTSTDLVNWKPAGSIFPNGSKPSWATGDFWAPEIHKVGSHYVAYFSSLDGADGKIAVGAATSMAATGPFKALAAPLVSDKSVGMIDPTKFDDAAGNHYLVWKEDGNANGNPTPIYAQPLDATGTSLMGARTTLISNDQGWEGHVTEGPFVVLHGGAYYLFYSGNSYANSSYAVGVARATSPLGPYLKAPAPIVTSNTAWAGPGHCSVVDGPDGGTYMIYHAWEANHVSGSPGRLTLVDLVEWGATWPSVPGAPSSHSRPLP